MPSASASVLRSKAARSSNRQAHIRRVGRDFQHPQPAHQTPRDRPRLSLTDATQTEDGNHPAHGRIRIFNDAGKVDDRHSPTIQRADSTVGCIHPLFISLRDSKDILSTHSDNDSDTIFDQPSSTVVPRVFVYRVVLMKRQVEGVCSTRETCFKA